jgi:hypothetical protein
MVQPFDMPLETSPSTLAQPQRGLAHELLSTWNWLDAVKTLEPNSGSGVVYMLLRQYVPTRSAAGPETDLACIQNLLTNGAGGWKRGLAHYSVRRFCDGTWHFKKSNPDSTSDVDEGELKAENTQEKTEQGKKITVQLVA